MRAEICGPVDAPSIAALRTRQDAHTGVLPIDDAELGPRRTEAEAEGRTMSAARKAARGDEIGPIRARSE